MPVSAFGVVPEIPIICDSMGGSSNQVATSTCGPVWKPKFVLCVIHEKTN